MMFLSDLLLISLKIVLLTNSANLVCPTCVADFLNTGDFIILKR